MKLRKKVERILALLIYTVAEYKPSFNENRSGTDRPNIPDGAWVTMITPFTSQNKIDWVG